MTLVTEDKSWK